MIIKKLKIKNFKSFDNIDIRLNDVNYVIGANAAGKSNFVNIFKFINDMVEYGLDDAIQLQGGIEYLKNVNNNENLLIEYEIDFEKEYNKYNKLFIRGKNDCIPRNLVYSIEINIESSGNYYIDNERIKIELNSLNKNKNIKLEMERNRKREIIDNYDIKNIKSGGLFDVRTIIEMIKGDGLFISNFFRVYGVIYSFYGTIKTYDFDVKALKSPSSIEVRNVLSENGSNLVNIIQHILKNEEKKEKLKRIVNTILPFVDSIKVENNINRSLFFKIKENYNKKEFPSNMLSDGTVSILAIIVALYFQEQNDIIILEEPERNIHPELLSKLVDIIKDVSEKKQIIITTHNPFIIRETNLDNVILVSRFSNGVSMLSKPKENQTIRKFLENDLGIDELFVDGVLK